MRTKDKASVVIVVNEQGKMLVLRRGETAGTFPGYWNFPGGAVEEGETIEAAGVRELEEESGIKVSEKDLVYFQVNTLPKIMVHFFMTNKYEGEVSLNWESTDYKWVSLEGLKELKFIPMPFAMFDDIKYYMRLIDE